MRPRKLAAVVLAMLPAACGSEPTPRQAAVLAAAAGAAGPDLPCTVEHLGSEPLVLEGGGEAYVEPQALVVDAEGILLAGAPSYLWRRVVAPRGVVREGANLFVAVHQDSAGNARAVAPPPEIGKVQHVRAARLPAGGWGAVLSTGTRDATSGSFSYDATWYAEYSGGSWSAPELLPRPPDGDPRLLGSTDLVAFGERLIWIVPWVADARRLLHFERRNGTWTQRDIGMDRFIEDVGLAAGPSMDLWLAIAGSDPHVPGDVRSLRLYRHAGTWELIQRVAELPPDAYVVDPRPVVTPGGVALSWLRHDSRASTAMTALGIGPEAPATTIPLADDVIQVAPLSLQGGTPVWVLARSLPSVLSSELQVLVGTPDGPRTVLTLPNPYTGYFAAAVHGRRITIVGPEFDPSPAEPTVRSLIINLGASCQ